MQTLNSKPKSAYIKTENGNFISRDAILHGIQNIILKSRTIIKPSTVLRGDLRRKGSGSAISISIGSYTQLHDKVVISPPIKEHKGELSYYPVKIGDFVSIGSSSVVEAVSIGSHVRIGRDCVIGSFVVIKDCCEVKDGSIVPDFTVLPPFTCYSGSPGFKY